ncbi:MAG TPA: DUF6174 domain-containing protein, partial [Longimicrobium sp.]
MPKLLIPTLVLLLAAVPGATLAQSADTLQGHATLSGRIFDLMTGLPVPAGRIAVDPIPGIEGQEVRFISADTTGRFTAELPAGAYMVRGMASADLGISDGLVRLGAADSVVMNLYLPPASFDAADRRARLLEMRQRRDQWVRERPTAYRFDVAEARFRISDGPWTLAVTPTGSVVLNAPEGGSPPKDATSIDSVFAWLARQFRDPSLTVVASYDPVLGYPVSIHTDGGRELDAWYHLKI